MGCFFTCFRFKDDVSHSTPSKSRDSTVSKNQLAAVFLCEEKGSPFSDKAGQDSIQRELKHEAKFLKACGALLETPEEFRKTSDKINVQTHEDAVASKFNPWLPGASCKRLHWDEQPDQVSVSPKSMLEDSSFLENKTEGCMPEKLQTKDNSILPALILEPSSVTSHSKVKSVRFEAAKNANGDESATEYVPLEISPPQSSDQMQPLRPMNSPYPTPLKLTDEMQTPGTIYPVKIENLGNTKCARIRSQYVYPGLNPVVNLSQWNSLREDYHQHGQSDDVSEQQVKGLAPDGSGQIHKSLVSSVLVDPEVPQSPGHLSPSGNRNPNNKSISNENFHSGRSPGNQTMMVGFESASPGNRDHGQLNPNRSPISSPSVLVSSLSQWVNVAGDDEKRENYQTVIKERSHSKSPDGDRPIIGIVAAHWNDENPSHVSPKWWDGKGIPNSTNKYKEDQKVSWHATPFEERLEKALSDDTLIPRRKLLNEKLFGSDYEAEESDTAAS